MIGEKCVVDGEEYVLVEAGVVCVGCAFEHDDHRCISAPPICSGGVWKLVEGSNTLQDKPIPEPVISITPKTTGDTENAHPQAKEGIGDVNSTERGSGARYNSGKPDLSLTPLETLFDEARVWMYGEKKYARFNWQKGMKWSVPLACALRHLAAWQRGEDLDPESGQPHLAHVMCNVRMLTYYAEHYPEGDDRAK